MAPVRARVVIGEVEECIGISSLSLTLFAASVAEDWIRKIK